jgi:selenide,water dikinase
MSAEIKLTQYSHGAGCGCKISPKILDTILKSELAIESFSNLLVGNESKDDAAVMDMGNGQKPLSVPPIFLCLL